MSNLVVDFPCNPIRWRRLGTPDSASRMPRTRPPSVRFSDMSTLYFYHEGPLDPAAGPSLWYSDEEKEASKRRAGEEIATLQRIKEAGLHLNQMGAALPADVSAVGLEQYLVSPEFTKKRWVTRRTVTMAVLTEQARGDDDADVVGVTDKQDRIARASRKHSGWSAVQAETIGFFQATSRGG